MPNDLKSGVPKPQVMINGWFIDCLLALSPANHNDYLRTDNGRYSKRLEPSPSHSHLGSFTRPSGTSLAAAPTTCSQLPQPHEFQLTVNNIKRVSTLLKWLPSHNKDYYHQSQLRLS